jgi:hypothetical protein
VTTHRVTKCLPLRFGPWLPLLRALPLLPLLPVLTILRAQTSLQDSLGQQILGIDIQKARMSAVYTDIWHRLIPRVSLSASLGVRDVFFIDPNTSLPYVLPRDVYRLTLTLSLDEILSSPKHALAELQVLQLQTQLARLNDHQRTTQNLLQTKRRTLAEDDRLLQEQIHMSEDLVRFRQLLFGQGKINYDVLVRSQMDLLDARRSLNRLRLQQAELQMHGPTPAFPLSGIPFSAIPLSGISSSGSPPTEEFGKSGIIGGQEATSETGSIP